MLLQLGSGPSLTVDFSVAIRHSLQTQSAIYFSTASDTPRLLRCRSAKLKFATWRLEGRRPGTTAHILSLVRPADLGAQLQRGFAAGAETE